MATTPRVTRTRSQTPLPAIGARPSYAYGAEGKTELRTQLRPGHRRDFGEDFGAARVASAAPKPTVEEEDEDEEEEEDDDDDDDVARSPPKRAGSSRPARPAPRSAPLGDRDRDRERMPPPPRPRRAPAAERTGTDLEARALYHGARPAHPAPAADDEPPEDHQPSSLRVLTRALPRYLRAILQNFDWKDLFIGFHALLFTFCFLSCFMLFLGYVPLPESWEPARNSYCYNAKRFFHISPYDLPPTELEDMWFKFRHDEIWKKELPTVNMPDLQWSINIRFRQRLDDAEARLNKLDSEMRQVEQSITGLQEMLPQQVVVSVVDGKYIIPAEFYQALQERLGEEGDMGPLWQTFVSRNEDQVERMHQQVASATLDRAMEDKQIITREMFAEMIQENNNFLVNKFDNNFGEWQKDHVGKLKEVAAHTATDVVKKSPLGQLAAREQLHNLLKYNQMYNGYEAIRAINWFSPNLGAKVDHRLTSPTQQPPSNGWFEYLFRKLSPTIRSPHPPIIALTRWEEQKDCWCAAKSPKGQSQIAVTISKKIFPNQLIIEHVPALGTNDIKAAPMDVEVWVDAGSEQAARRISGLLEDVEQIAFTKKCDSPPWPTYVCIGRGKYDIHYDNYVQPINLVRAVDEMAVGVDKFIVRVNENWGANWTCLYRLRMTGEELG